MFRNLSLFEDVPCPALTDEKPCILNHCLFSHNIRPPPLHGSEAPSIDLAPPILPPPLPLPPPDPRLRAIVEGKKTVPVPKRRKLEGGLKADGDDVYERDGGVSLEGLTVEDAAPSLPPPATKKKRSILKSTEAEKERLPQTSDAPRKRLAEDSPKTKPAVAPLRTANVPIEKPLTTENPLSLNPRTIPRAPAQHGVRYQLIVKLHEQLTRLYGNPSDHETTQLVNRKTLDMEEEIAITKRTIYTSAMGRLVMRLSKLSKDDYQKEIAAEETANKAAPEPAQAMSTVAGLNNSKPPIDTGLTPEEEIECLRDLVHPIRALKKYKYLLSPPTDAEIATARSGEEAGMGYEQCNRCSQRFQIFRGRREADGVLASGGSCSYHIGKKLRRTKRSTEQEWDCCGRTVGMDAGCITSSSHVYKVSDHKRLSLSLPFIITPPNSDPDAASRALAVDCEMGYTTYGMELIRLTATAFPSGAIVIDSLVRPKGEVLDFNSRYSGITADMLTSASVYKPRKYPPLSTPIINPTSSASHSSPQLPILPSPSAARDALLKYIGPTTPLIGHSLNNDLDVLGLVHKSVVDTVILFPHKMGLPRKNRLKFCVEQFLGREIQKEDDDQGHDSVIDARCAGELGRWKVRERKR